MMTDRKTPISILSQKDQLAAFREQRLAELRARSGKTERFTYIFACAEQGGEFEVTFARPATATQFTCEAVSKVQSRQPASILDRLHRLFQRDGGLSVPADQISMAGIDCVYCGANDGRWTVCRHCRAAVCSSGFDGPQFHCRCGQSFQTEPLKHLDGSGAGQPSHPRLGHTGLKRLR